MKRRQFCQVGLLNFIAVSMSRNVTALGEKRPLGVQISKRATREEIVRARTEDGFEQTGLLVMPAGSRPHPTAVIWVHGATANFYYPSYVDIARATASLGYTFLTVNTRMHDIGSVLGERPDGTTVRGGIYWGLPSKEPLDIAAWVTYAQQQGYSSIVLVGHSAGGPAVWRYMVERPDKRVIGWVLASVGMGPNPISTDPAREERSKIATQMVASGHGQDFLPNLRLSAATFLDYADTPEYLGDFFGRERSDPAIMRVHAPLLAWYGSKGDVGTAADLETMRALIAKRPSGPARVDTAIVENTDHDYAGQAGQVAFILANWISRLPAH